MSGHRRLRAFAQIQAALAAYVWLMFWIPIGNWNRQSGQRILPRLLAGGEVETDDIVTLAFVTAPAVLAYFAYGRSNRWLAIGALMFTAVWTALQVQSWWIPYIFGTEQAWRLKYAEGPTTKLLPSFPGHPTPDGMHLAIHVLLVIALVFGVAAIRGMNRD